MAKRVQKLDHWRKLLQLIKDYAEARIAESWKGGGDPADIPVIEANEKLAEANLFSHIEKMRREFE